MPNQQESIDSLEWFYTKEIITISQIHLINMIAKENLWQWFIQTIENGSNTEKQKYNTLMSSKQWAKSIGEKKEDGLQSCSCIVKFTWETCKLNKTRTKKQRKWSHKKIKRIKCKVDMQSNKILYDFYLLCFLLFNFKR